MRPEKPRYRAGLGAWRRDLKPLSLSALPEAPRESPWQRRRAGRLMVQVLDNVLVEVSLGGTVTEDARE